MGTEWEKVESSFAVPWTPENIGDQIIGRYIGVEKIPSPQDNQEPFDSYRIELSEPVTDAVGNTVNVYGVSGAFLASLFDHIRPGTLVKVTYQGKEKSKRGMAKQWTVECPKGTKFLRPGEKHDGVPF